MDRKTIKITADYLVDFLVEFNSKKYAHKDYIELFEKQLKVILKIINIEGLIEFDATDEQKPKFIFKRLFKDYIRGEINQETIYESINMTEKVINWTINSALDKINISRSIRDRGQLTSFDDMETVHRIINTRQKDYTIEILNKSIIDLYKEEIKECLRLLYTADPFYKKNLKDKKTAEDSEWDIQSLNRVTRSWSINNYASEEETLLLDQRICDFDYF